MFWGGLLAQEVSELNAEKAADRPAKRSRADPVVDYQLPSTFSDELRRYQMASRAVGLQV